MLQRVGSSRYRARESETVTIVAVAQNNNGVESASFRYGIDILAPRVVQGHPGCDFVVERGGKMFGISVLFDTGTTTARYDLFEEDDNGNLVDLRFAIEQPFGPIGQFQVDGIPIAAIATATPRRTGVRATNLAPIRKAKAARKATKKSTRKAVTKKAAKTKAAKKKTAKTGRRRTTGRAATSAARKHEATGKRTRRTSVRRKPR